MAKSALSAALSAYAGPDAPQLPRVRRGSASAFSSSSPGPRDSALSSSFGSSYGIGKQQQQQQRRRPSATSHGKASEQRRVSGSVSPATLKPVSGGSSRASVPVSPNMFPFSPPLSGVRVLRDQRRRGSSVVTTTILSPYDGDLMFSSSFDDRDSVLGEEDEIDMDNMDVDDMDLDGDRRFHSDAESDTDEEDWQSAGVESLRRGNAFHLMQRDTVSSVSSDSMFSSRTSVSSFGDSKVSVFSQSVPAVAMVKPKTLPTGQIPAGFGSHKENVPVDREADAIQALVQLRSL
ncbi:hypothetical protein BZA70DRAFT_290663 [Myxozyma melibiosi]|uniref:Uncharacterized protein n=1 Tax=Myxozyma melibiosi TaxID=54550 RepID=A0ABR1F2P0_9ASCO